MPNDPAWFRWLGSNKFWCLVKKAACILLSCFFLTPSDPSSPNLSTSLGADYHLLLPLLTKAGNSRFNQNNLLHLDRFLGQTPPLFLFLTPLSFLRPAFHCHISAMTGCVSLVLISHITPISAAHTLLTPQPCSHSFLQHAREVASSVI